MKAKLFTIIFVLLLLSILGGTVSAQNPRQGRVTVSTLSITPRGTVLRTGDTISSSITYRANVPTKVANYGGWVYSGVPARAGTCMGQPVPPAPGADFPFIMNEASYTAGRVTSAMGPFTFSEGTDKPYEQTNRYVYRVRIYNANTNEMLYCYQKVWTIQRAPQVSVTSVEIYPQTDVIRTGDAFGHNLGYTANVSTNVNVYGGWVYSDVPASTGSCLDQPVPPAPGTDFPFFAIPFNYPAGSVSSSWQPAAFSETTEHPYEQTDRYVYRVNITDATTNQTLYCYQKVWTIDRSGSAANVTAR